MSDRNTKACLNVGFSKDEIDNIFGVDLTLSTLLPNMIKAYELKQFDVMLSILNFAVFNKQA